MGGPEHNVDGWQLLSYELDERTGVGRAHYERSVLGAVQTAERFWENRAIPHREESLR